MCRNEQATTNRHVQKQTPLFLSSSLFPSPTLSPGVVLLLLEQFDDAQQKHSHIYYIGNFSAAVGRHDARLDGLVDHTIAAFPHQHHCGDERSTNKALGKAHFKQRALPVTLCVRGWYTCVCVGAYM